MKLLIFIFSIALRMLYSIDPYFSYSDEELRILQLLPESKMQISKAEVQKWDDLVRDISHKTPLQDGGNQRFFAYLYVGQRDFFALTEGKGSIAPITKKIIMLFFPEQVFTLEISDEYSENVANLIFQKIKNRYEEEQAHLEAYPLKAGGVEYWHEPPPLIGQKVGSCKTWLIGSVKKFRLPEPPSYKSLIWGYGIFEILKLQEFLSREVKEEIDYWADKAEWNYLCKQALEKKEISLADQFLLLSDFAMILVDAMISSFDNKYTYQVLRPHMRNSQVKLIIPPPKHPSYPSGHSVISSAAATVLAHYFPEEEELWKIEAYKAGDSRVAAGLHYEIDNEHGLILGERIANHALYIISTRR